MGKAAAAAGGDGPGGGGGARGLASLLSAVPCLSCHTEAPAMSALPPLASTLPPPPETPEEAAGAAALADKQSGAEDSSGSSPDILKGWLFKWTNYLKGYQRRWFVLSNGLLSYYRNQGEMAYNCRATINLSTAHFDREDSCNIWLSYGGRTYHLKAGSEVERQQWLGALELARAKAVRMMSTLSGTFCGFMLS